MRRTRRLLLFLILLICGAVGIIFNFQRLQQARNARSAPVKLPETLSARADKWSYSKTEHGRPVVDVEAQSLRQNSDGTRTELQGVELKLYHKDGASFDKVKSAKADFDVVNRILYSEGEVEITMGVPTANPEPSGRLVVVKTSGVRFDSQTGRATTEQPAHFQFDRGEGDAVGADYDPQTRELQMHKDVKLTWRGDDPSDKPMQVEAGSLIYKEAESKILLLPWSKFKRDTLEMTAGPSVVTLNKGIIQLVETQQARGIDNMPERRIEYAADGMRMNFSEKGIVQSIVGENNAKLVSTARTAVTSVSSKRLDLDFDTANGESVLKTALANGSSVIESKPVPRKGVPVPDTRILRADSIAMNMRPGGKEIDKVETHSPGVIEFHPNDAKGRHRTMTGERMTIQYGPENQIESFRAYLVTTRTDPAAQPKGKKPLPPALTSSKEMSAEFDPATGAMQKMEQWDNFRYEEGDRKAKSQRAKLDSPRNLITLTGAARAWDATSSTSADSIAMNQATSDFEATGNVNSTRLPDKKPDTKQNGMLSGDEPLQAKADRMVSSENRQKIEYTGNALLWQGASRVQGDRVVIDRKNGRLEAYGKVMSQLLDKSGPQTGPAGPPKKAPVFTTVKAPELLYLDKERIAHYKGGSTLNRSNMVVTSRELRAFLKQGESDSSLEKAFADGAVKIVQTTAERTRTGTSEHAEYYPDEGKTILTGGPAQLVDTVKGVTRGRQLTYFSGDEKLLVEGAPNQLVESTLIKK